MSIALVSDSTADLPPELASALNITIVPLEISLGGRVYRDGVDISTRELFHRVTAERLAPLTSQPSLGSFVRAYRRLVKRFQSIISVHLSSSFSGTFDAADLARRSLPGADITVVDSGSFTLGLGLQVLAAARAAAAGRGKEEILRLLAAAARGAEILGVLDDLDFLRRGGRLGLVRHLAASVLRVKPLIRIAGGQARSLGLNRRRDQAVASLLERVRGRSGNFLLGVMHTGAPAEAEEVRCALEGSGARVELVVEAGPVVGSHVGPRALGVAAVPA